MEIIDSNIIYEDKKHSRLVNKNICFFDIETTGLSRDRDIIYLIGILYFDNSKSTWKLRQYFAPDLKDEVDLLIEAVQFLSGFDTIVNFNGNSFDIPFVNHRLKLLNLDMEVPREKSLDIYAILRSNKAYLDLENLKLTTIERYLGIYREDIYSGRDCIKFYKDFVVNGDPVLRERILKHNYDDLYYLLEVLDILPILENKKTIKVKKDKLDLSLVIDSMKLEKDFFTVHMRIEGSLKEGIFYYGDIYKIFINDEGLLELSFEFSRGLVSPTEEAYFIVNRELALDDILPNNYGYRLPNDITLISIENKYLIDNIKSIISALMYNIM